MYYKSLVGGFKNIFIRLEPILEFGVQLFVNIRDVTGRYDKLARVNLGFKLVARLFRRKITRLPRHGVLEIIDVRFLYQNIVNVHVVITHDDSILECACVGHDDSHSDM